eukprot:5501873-Pyramimonas_sp.AAC.1
MALRCLPRTLQLFLHPLPVLLQLLHLSLLLLEPEAQLLHGSLHLLHVSSLLAAGLLGAGARRARRASTERLLIAAARDAQNWACTEARGFPQHSGAGGEGRGAEQPAVPKVRRLPNLRSCYHVAKDYFSLR